MLSYELYSIFSKQDYFPYISISISACFTTCALRKDDFQMFITILTKTTLMFSHFLTSSYFVSIPPDLDLHLSQYPSSDITKVELRLSKHLLFFNFDV